jgi:hypothetical protein
LEIKNQPLKSFVYSGLLFSSLIILTWNLLFIKHTGKKIAAIILPLAALIFIMVIGPMKIEFSKGAWKTQTVLYQNGHLRFKKVEHQMQDVGALGYNQRTVEVLYLTRFFMIVSPVEPDIDTRIEWTKVNKDVNELGLKY